VEEKTAFRKSLFYPVLFVSILWIIRLLEEHYHWHLAVLGIHPLSPDGLLGIITAPFIHSGFEHLASNTPPLLIVGTGLFYFYKEIALRVIGIIWLFTNFWVWLAARPDYHIGASGLIYGFVVFLFFSGIFRGDRRLLAISLLVTFLYGSLVWGILPVNQAISFESHLFGSIAGFLCAVYFRKEGPQKVQHVWVDDDLPDGDEYWKVDALPGEDQPTPPPEQQVNINYVYKEKNENE